MDQIRPSQPLPLPLPPLPQPICLALPPSPKPSSRKRALACSETPSAHRNLPGVCLAELQLRPSHSKPALLSSEQPRLPQHHNLNSPQQQGEGVSLVPLPQTLGLLSHRSQRGRERGYSATLVMQQRNSRRPDPACLVEMLNSNNNNNNSPSPRRPRVVAYFLAFPSLPSRSPVSCKFCRLVQRHGHAHLLTILASTKTKTKLRNPRHNLPWAA